MAKPRRSPRRDNSDLEVEIEAAASRMVDLIVSTMAEQGVSRADLARRLGVSRPHVTQFLRGDRTVTLPTAVEALFYMGKRLDIDLSP